ncbi:MAG TPA: energy transducer TonB [Bryobacteraceae bacterium]|nr:energy transducer TonB [Bryobacteraceae bacterium]
MFEQTFVNTQGQTRKPWTVAASLLFQSGIIAIALLVPLLRVAALQRPETLPVWLAPPTPQRVVQRETKPAMRTSVASRPIFRLESLQAPTAVPRKIDLAPDAPEVAMPVSGAPAGTSVFSLVSGNAVQPPPVAVPPVNKTSAPVQSAPLHVSGGVQSAKLIFGPKPAYPALAKATHTMGTVRLQATIGRDGAIRNVQVLSGPPLLIEAAKQAVEQWRYQPTLLNNQTVEVITEIDVNFTIAQ